MSLRIMCDIDGTLNAAVPEMTALLRALHDAGNYVALVSGIDDNPKSGNTWQAKAQYLQSLGVTQCWDDLVVVSGDIPALKSQWCLDNNIDLAIDNSIPNARSLIDIGLPMVLVPWATRNKNDESNGGSQ